MVRIRLTLRGKKNQPTFRVVVIDSKKKRDGKYIDDLGYFNPQLKPAKCEIDKEKYNLWINKGAKPSDTVLKLLEGKYEFIKYDRKKANVVEEHSNGTETVGNIESDAKETAKEETQDVNSEDKKEE